MRPYTNGHARPHLVNGNRLHPALLPVAPSTRKASPAAQVPSVTSPATEDGPWRSFTRVIRKGLALGVFLGAVVLCTVVLVAVFEATKSGPITLVWLAVLVAFLTVLGVVVSWEWQR